jgi:hypothetical protein
MKKFLSRVCKFFCLNAAIVTVVVAAVYFILSGATFVMPKDKNILVLGDSHTECAIDDSIFTRSLNISQSAAAYLYSYTKLRKFLAVNPHIDTVFLSFHGGSIQKSLDELILEDRRILERVPQYFSLLRTEELSLFVKNPAFYSALVKLPTKSIRVLLKFMIKHTLTYKDLYIGGYLKLDRDRLQQALEQQENNTVVETGYSGYQIDYLLKIIELCNERGVELILFNAPTYDAGTYGNLRALNDFYTTYCGETRYLDYSDFPLPDYGYGDIGHLNFKGAKIFSQYLQDNYDGIFN